MRTLMKSLIPSWALNRYRKSKQNQIRRQLKQEFQGNNVECPLCESTYRQFAPFGVKKRANALCPNCDSLERHRLIYLFLKLRLDFMKPKFTIPRVLHFAPEKAYYDMFFSMDDIVYIPCDLEPENYDHGDIKTQKIDITDIPFSEGYFELILCNHILEHIPDDKKAMEELYRVMASGGSGILQVPIHPTRKETYEDSNITNPIEREKAFGQEDNVRWYATKDYIKRLESVGFEVEEVDLCKILGPELTKRYGLLSIENVFYCKKH